MKIISSCPASMQFINLKSQLIEPEHPEQVPRPMKQGIFFENVSFKYPGTANDVVRDVTVRVKPGQIVALVGENGAGKSTLIKLLCRLYDPMKGTIKIDGVRHSRIRKCRVETRDRYHISGLCSL